MIILEDTEQGSDVTKQYGQDILTVFMAKAERGQAGSNI